MKKRLIGAAAGLTLLGGGMGFLGTSAADPAFVLNSQDGVACSLGPNPGSAQSIVDHEPDGVFDTVMCHGTWVLSPPTEALHLVTGGPHGTTCKVVVTPAGAWRANCKR